MLPNLIKLDNASVTPEEKQQCSQLSEKDLVGAAPARSNSALRQATPTLADPPQVKNSFQSQPSASVEYQDQQTIIHKDQKGQETLTQQQ